MSVYKIELFDFSDGVNMRKIAALTIERPDDSKAKAAALFLARNARHMDVCRLQVTRLSYPRGSFFYEIEFVCRALKPSEWTCGELDIPGQRMLFDESCGD